MTRSRIHLTFLLFLLAIAATFGVAQQARAQDQHCTDGFAEPPAVDPRNPQVVCLPEVGAMSGELSCPNSTQSEQLGRELVALGQSHVDGLGSWLVGHFACDHWLDFAGYRHYAYELLLYHGRINGLPREASGLRVGPREVLSETRVIAIGDFDGDSLPDAVCSIRLFGDTSNGNKLSDYYDIGYLTVFWGQPDGSLSIDDTTRLSNGVADNWLDIGPGTSGSFNSAGGASDLVVTGGAGLRNGKIVGQTHLCGFRGRKGIRWGRKGSRREPEWNWWNAPKYFEYLTAVDQQGDGVLDLALGVQNDGPGFMTVLYGKPGGGIPDTTDMETIDTHSAGNTATLLQDVTGDNIPELITMGLNSQIRVYIGFKGQRLKDMFGSGNDSAPGGSIWWGKPWRIIDEPNRLNSHWFQPINILYNLGDINFDGVGDIATYCTPWITFYNGGRLMDSYIDGMIDGRAAGVPVGDYAPSAVALLGDIDGSGVPTIAVGGEGIIYVKPSRGVPISGERNDIPPGTGPASVLPEGTDRKAATLQFRAVPNPSGRQAEFQWNSAGLSGSATIVMSSEDGKELGRISAPASDGRAQWSFQGSGPGNYFIALRTNAAIATMVMRIQ